MTVAICIKSLHRRAMDQVDLALAAQMRGEYEVAIGHRRAAYELEFAALQMLGPGYGLEPTRSVLARSAATLALDCGLADAASRLARDALDEGPPPEVAEELSEVLARAEALLSECKV